MTGFGKATLEGTSWNVSVLIRSLNGKGLELFFKSNINLLPLEMELRNRTKERIRRGSLTVQVEALAKRIPLELNPEAVKEGVRFVRALSQDIGLNLSDDVIFQVVLRLMERTREELDEELKELILQAFDLALEELIISRKKEGEELKKDIQEKLSQIVEEFEKIKEKRHEVFEALKKRLLEKAQELSLDEKDPLLINEMTFLLSRIDVEEEVSRFEIHLRRFQELLDADGEVGKRMEFLLQELHREINTLGNKMPELSPHVVNIKVNIDRLKQQCANVE